MLVSGYKNMKIYPIKIYNHYSNTNNQNNVMNNGSKDYRQINDLPSCYAPQISFGDNLDEFKNQLLHLDGVHCPGCGCKMLSDEKLKEIVDQAEKTRNIVQYAKLLEKNRDYFHPEFQDFISYVIDFSKNTPDKSFTDLFRILNKGTSVIMKKHFKDNAEYLKKTLDAEVFSTSDQEKISKCIEYLSTLDEIPKFGEIKKNLMATIGSLDSDKKWDIYVNVKKDIHNIYGYSYNLKFRDKETAGLPAQAAVVYNMLSNSKNKIAEIYANKGYEKRFNQFLMCKSCSYDYKSFSSVCMADNAREKLKNYANDIASAIANGKLKNNNLYLYEFLSGVSNFTKDQMKIERSQINGVAKDKIFTESKSEYRFQNYENIPCACCGTPMLTHEQKQDIYRQILDCSNLHELQNVARINSKYINPRYKLVLERFNKILDKKPDISEEDLMNLLQDLSRRDLKQQIERNKNAVLKYQAKYNLNYLDNEFINDFVYRINRNYKTISKDKEFEYYLYKRIVNYSLGKISAGHRDRIVKIGKTNIKDLYLQDRLVNPIPAVVEKTGGSAKAMFQNIFKGSVITVDHITARDSGGADDNYNKIGYCHDCNRAKTNMNFTDWYDIHPEISENLPKHLEAISKIIKEEKIKDMYDYPQKVARLSMNLAKGKLKISDKYDTKG